MNRSRYLRGDFISGATLTGLGTYIIIEARGWDYTTPDGPGPGFFPIWYGIAMVVLSVVLVASTLARPARAAEGEGVNWREVGNALTAWAALAVCIGMLKILGFAVSFALLAFFVVAFIYGRPVKTALLVGCGGSLGFHLLFSQALNVSLPVGVLGF